MPLIKSAGGDAFAKNVSAEMKSGRPQNQALAIAYRVKRDAARKKMAKGGRVKGYAPGGMVNVGPTAAPFHVRNAARATERVPGGIITSTVPGRSDRIPMGVKGGSYVVPADVVSSLGQGNTMAGAQGLSRMLKMTPGGAPMGSSPMARRPGKFADGGEVMMPPGDAAPPVDIMAAGGEFVVPVDKVAEIGGGDVKRGHDILDSMVKQTRKKAVKTLRKLPGPRKR